MQLPRVLSAMIARGASRTKFSTVVDTDSAAAAAGKLHERVMSTGTVYGEKLEHNLDLTRARPGHSIAIPYEMTVGEAWRDMWQTNFYQHDRIMTSHVFATKLGFDDVLMPFSQALFIAGSMSHIDESRKVMDLGYKNAVYELPIYAGMTLSKTFHIKAMRQTSEGNNTIITVNCELFDKSTGERLFHVDKIMLYPELIQQAKSKFRRIEDIAPKPVATQPQSLGKLSDSALLDAIVAKSSRLPKSTSLASLRTGQLILHPLSRPIGRSSSMNLATMFRLTHPLLYNTTRFKPEEIVVSGGLVLAASHALASRSLYEVLYEEMIDASFQNRVGVRDNLAAVSYVLDIQEIGDKLEQVTVRTFGLKDVDVVRALREVELPRALFEEHKLKPKEYEQICKNYCPILQGKIVVQSLRRIVRQAPHQDAIFLL